MAHAEAFLMVLLAACGGAGSGGGAGGGGSGGAPKSTVATPEKADMFARADSYERFMGRWSRQLAPSLLGFAGLRDGDNVLDVGSGTGALTFAILDTAKTARVTGIEPSEGFVAYASHARTDPRARFEVGDAQAITFPNAGFDKVLALLVMNFVPDPAKALGEMVRVTKPGGVVAAAVWDYGEGMEMLRVFFDEASALDPAVHDEKDMPLCKQGELGALWRKAGLDDVREEALVITLHFQSFADFWGPFLLGTGPSGAYVAKLPPDRRAALEQRLRARLLGGGADRPFELHARAWAVRGTVR